jgi:hypothetical protein
LTDNYDTKSDPNFLSKQLSTRNFKKTKGQSLLSGAGLETIIGLYHESEVTKSNEFKGNQNRYESLI